MLQMYGQCYHVIRLQLRRLESAQSDFRKDRTGLKILENNKNIQSIISVNTNILLRRFRLKFLRIMCSTSCYKEFTCSDFNMSLIITIKPRLHFIFPNDSKFGVRNLFAAIVIAAGKYYSGHGILATTDI
jgi:hypothetical protein